MNKSRVGHIKNHIKPTLGLLTGFIYYWLINHTTLTEIDRNFVGFVLMFPLVALQIKWPSKNILLWTLSLLIPFTLIYALCGDHVAEMGASYKAYTTPWATLRVLFYLCMLSGFIVFVFYCTAIEEKRWSFPYTTLFQEAWLIILKLCFSIVFVVLTMGFFFLISVLFKLINITFVEDVVKSALFHQVMMPFLFGIAFMILDDKEELIQKIRSLLLALCKFLYPIFVVVSILFLAVLPFSAQSFQEICGFSVFLSSLNILLFNGIFQDGIESRPYGSWVCKLIYVAMFMLCFYAVAVIPYPWLQMNDSKTNPGLFLLSEITVIFLALYHLSYCVSIVFSKKSWLSLVKTSNKIMAIVIAITYLLLSTPYSTF